MKLKLGLVLIGLAVLALSLKSSDRAQENSSLHYSYELNQSAYTGVLNPGEFEPIGDAVFGMIASHHFYAERLIAKAFLQIKRQKPSRIVIIGPDHFGASKYDIAVSKLPYSTPFGLLEPDEKIIIELERIGALPDERAFEHEHSISALTGIIKGVFPDAKLVPMILDRNINYGKLQRLAKTLDEVLPQDSLIVASVDFSHHLNRFAADFHDFKSVATLESFDLESIKGLEVDSPPSLYTLTKYLELRGAQKMIYENTNQAYISGNLDSGDVTSYVFAHFTKGEPHESAVTARLLVPEGFSDFEGISGPEGNFLKGIDERIVYGADLKQRLDLVDTKDRQTYFLLGELQYNPNRSKYYVFPFRTKDGSSTLLDYAGAIQSCREILVNKEIVDECSFHHP